MVVRALLVLLAALLVVSGVARVRAHERCEDVVQRTFELGAGGLPSAGSAGMANDMIAACSGGKELVAAAAVFVFVGQPRIAERVALEAVRREPRRRDSWRALGRARAKLGDAEGAAQALERAAELDPLGGAADRGSLNRSNGRSTR